MILKYRDNLSLNSSTTIVKTITFINLNYNKE